MDWLSIRNEYITTKISCRRIAEKYGCSVSAVLQRCKAEKWVQQRNQYCIKTASKVESVCSDAAATRAAQLYNCADVLMLKLMQMLDSADSMSVSDICTCARAVKELKNIYGIKDAYDIREQELKIKLLEKQLEDNGADKTITVLLSDELQQYSC